jgi:hypothetical protein
LSGPAKPKRIPLALAKVRKELPPPAKVFKDKHKETRKRSKESLRQELKDSTKR